MNIIDIFKLGMIDGLEKSKPKHVITFISNIFIFEDKVYKIYKTDNELFNKNYNDLSDKKKRFAFTRKDFDWNNRLSPEIYTKLSGVIVSGESIKFVPPTDEADELVIEMNKIDMSNQIIMRLVENRISMDDCYEIGKQFGEKVLRLPKMVPAMTAYEDFKLRYRDFRDWVKSADEIPEDLGRKYIEYSLKFLEDHKSGFNSTDLIGACVDVHADNAILNGKTFMTIDTYATKEAWLQGYKFINIYRIASDIYAFLGKEYFEKVLEGYVKATGEVLPREYDKFLIIYSELVMWPYQYMLAKHDKWRLDAAKRHGDFIEEIFQSK